MRIGVPYEAALTMPLPFALAVLSGGRLDNTRISSQGDFNVKQRDSNASNKVVATHRKSKMKEGG